jgi:hypothetical protein
MSRADRLDEGEIRKMGQGRMTLVVGTKLPSEAAGDLRHFQ